MSEAESITTELIQLEIEIDIVLDGVLWTPEAGASETAIALFPGTGAEFYTNWFAKAGPRLAAAGYMTLALNRRDHGANFGFHTLDAGSADQRHGVDLLIGRGADRVVMGGHSFGTVTVPWYLAETDDARVPGMLLYAPLGDLRPASVMICGGQESYDRIVTEAREAVASERGDEAFLIPPMGAGGLPLMQTYEVFLDKRGPESRAVPVDIITRVGDRPMLGVRDPADAFPATRPPAREQLEAANPNLEYVLLDDIRDGAMTPVAHYYLGREDEVLAITLDWLERHGFTP